MDRDTARELLPPKKISNSVENSSSYLTIRNECETRIQNRAREGYEYCFYRVPTMHWGLPLYDPSDIFDQLFKELNDGRFQLIGWKEEMRLFIGWFEDSEAAMGNIPFIPVPFDTHTPHGDEVEVNEKVTPLPRAPRPLDEGGNE